MAASSMESMREIYSTGIVGLPQALASIPSTIEPRDGGIHRHLKDAGRLDVQDCPWLHSEFKASIKYMKAGKTIKIIIIIKRIIVEKQLPGKARFRADRDVEGSTDYRTKAFHHD